MKKGDLAHYVGIAKGIRQHGYLWLVERPSGLHERFFYCQSLATGAYKHIHPANMRKHDDEEG